MENLKIRGLMLHEKIRHNGASPILEFYYNLGICPSKEIGKENVKRALNFGIETTINCGKIKVLSFRFRYHVDRFGEIPKIREKIRSICEEPASAILYTKDVSDIITEFAKIRMSLFPTHKIYFYNTNESELKKEMKKIQEFPMSASDLFFDQLRS